MERHGGSLHTNTSVAEVCLEHKRAVGVRLHDGSMIRARRGVISNASPWDTLALINPQEIPSSWGKKVSNTPACHGFLHWHLALRGEDLQHLPVHHVWVGDWQRGIAADRNMVVLSMPSLLDPHLAPPGQHVLHGYTPANEPWHLWEHLQRGTPEYKALKAERCGVFHQVLDPLRNLWATRPQRGSKLAICSK